MLLPGSSGLTWLLRFLRALQVLSEALLGMTKLGLSGHNHDTIAT